ncbi:MAG: hypothetical protein ACI3YC_06125 [Alloprevotella sp.]
MKRTMKLLLSLTAWFLGFSGLVAQTYDENGFGTDEGGNTIYQPATLNGDDAYEIGNAGQLFWFAGLVNGTLDGVEQNAGANAVLTADIDLNPGITFNISSGSSSGSYRTFTPMGSESEPYTGEFNGDSHRLSGLFFFNSSSSCAALFSFTGSGATIRDLTLSNSLVLSGEKSALICGKAQETYFENITIESDCGVRMTGNSHVVGSIAAHATENTVFDHCVNHATLSSKGNSNGGIVGLAESNTTIICCANHGPLVAGVYQNGGIVGSANDCEIIECVNTGNITVSDHAGGLVGYLVHSKLSNSLNTGNVTNTGTNYCYVGGLVANSLSNSSVTGCLNTGTVTGASGTGNRATLTVSNISDGGTNTTECTYALEQSGVDAGTGSTVTTEQLASGEVCWLLNGEKSIGTWRQNLGGEDALPVLDNTHAAVSYGYDIDGNLGYGNEMRYATNEPAQDAEGRYLLENPLNLKWFSALVNGTLDGVAKNNAANAVVTADIDMTEVTGWVPIGYCFNDDVVTGRDNDQKAYDGVFDGQGHIISNLSLELNSVSHMSFGLFGGVSGTVKNLGVEGFHHESDNGSWHRTGSLAGMVLKGGLVDHCFARNCRIIVTGYSAVGGFAGANYGGTITDSYAYNCEVQGSRSGVFVADNRNDARTLFGTLIRCASSGSLHDASMASTVALTDCRASVATEVFNSGELTYWLNDRGLSTAWRQNLGAENPDVSPMLNESRGIVYYGEKTDEVGVFAYTNDRLSVSHTHVADADGWCHLADDRCNGFVPAVFNEEANAFDIENAGQLFWFAALVNGTLLDGTTQDKNANARLTRDIVVNEGVMTAASEAAHVWKPIAGGDEDILYKGTFDGQNHTISGLFSNLNASHSALVGRVAGTVKNVGVMNSYFYANPGSGCCAPVVARLNTGGVIEHCFARNSTANCLFFTGGICGLSYANTRITDCYVEDCHLSGQAYMGGLVGQAAGEISRCVAQTDFTLSDNASNVGHLVGKDNGAGVSASFFIDSPLEVSEVCALGEAKTGEEMASGAVVALLNDSREALVWGQRLGEDAIPVFLTPNNELLTADIYVRGKKSSSVIYNRDGELTLPEVENGYVVMNAAEGVTGRNVILHEGDTYTCADLHISNASAFSTPFAFTAEKATFHIQTPEDYVWANGAGGWHGICVPFNGTLQLAGEAKHPCPALHEEGDYWLKELKGFDAATNTLLFDFSSTIEAGKPYIIAFPGASRWPDDAFEGKGEITIYGEDVDFPTTAQATETFGYYYFAGTMKGKAALSPDASGARYVLNEDGTSFVQSYSAVPAYGAYIFSDVLEFAPKRLNISDWNGESTGILSPTDGEQDGSNAAVYDLSGRRVADNADAARRLPHGIYVVNGKKVMK